MTAGPVARALEARKIAIFGASSDPGKLGHMVAAELLTRGYGGEVVLVNPRGGEVLGHPVSRDPAAARDADLAVLWTPGTSAIEILATCAEQRIPLAVVCGNGFREAGDHRAEERLLATAERLGVRLIGPNTMGIDVPATGLLLNLNPDAPVGGVSLVAQSGGIVQMIGARLGELGAGFDAVISVGNKLDVGFTETVRVLADRPRTTAMLLYLEDSDEGDGLFTALAEAAAAMPVVVLLGGRTSAGARAARSHTGAMLSRADRLAGMLESAGVYAARSLAEACAVAGARSLAPPRQPPGDRILLLADGGAAAVLQADALVDAGHRLPPPGPALDADVRGILGRPMSNPFELAGAGDGRLDVIVDVLEAALVREAYDLTVLAVPFGSYAAVGADWGAGETAAVDRLCALAARRPAPIVVWSPFASRPGLAAPARLRAAGIPCVEWPEEAVAVVSAAVDGRRRRAPRAAAAPPGRATLAWDPGLGPATDRVLDALEAHGVAHAVGRVVARDAVLRLRSGEWVLRLDGFAHKTWAGAVEVGVAASGAPAAFDALRELARAHGAPAAIRLAPYVAHDGELLVALWRDPRRGDGCAIGAGGLRAEERADLAASTPVRSDEDVRALLARTQAGRRVLDDPRHLAPALDAVRRLARAFDALPELGELEINPLALGAAGATVLDVLPS